MTQTERFLRFAQRQAQLRETQVLVRIENGEVVLTLHWPLFDEPTNSGRFASNGCINDPS